MRNVRPTDRCRNWIDSVLATGTHYTDSGTAFRWLGKPSQKRKERKEEETNVTINRVDGYSVRQDWIGDRRWSTYGSISALVFLLDIKETQTKKKKKITRMYLSHRLSHLLSTRFARKSPNTWTIDLFFLVSTWTTLLQPICAHPRRYGGSKAALSVPSPVQTMRSHLQNNKYITKKKYRAIGMLTNIWHVPVQLPNLRFNFSRTVNRRQMRPILILSVFLSQVQ